MQYCLLSYMYFSYNYACNAPCTSCTFTCTCFYHALHGKGLFFWLIYIPGSTSGVISSQNLNPGHHPHHPLSADLIAHLRLSQLVGFLADIYTVFVTRCHLSCQKSLPSFRRSVAHSL